MITLFDFYAISLFLSVVTGVAVGFFVYRVGAYRARFEKKNLPSSGDTSPGGVTRCSL